MVTGGGKPNSVDPNSASIVRGLSFAYPTLRFSAESPSNLESVNIDDESNVVAIRQIQGRAYGFADDPYNDDPSYSIPITNPWREEGGSGFCSSGNGECHAVVLDTVKGIVWETYKSGTYCNGIGLEWDSASGVYCAEGGGVENLHHPYNIEPMTVDEADIPMMGTTDWGEDETTYNNATCRAASSCVIPHIVAFFLPTVMKDHRGYVDPADYGPLSCYYSCQSNPIPGGARLRLHSSYACPAASSYPQANMLCNQAKQYGWILDDFTGISNGGGIRLGESSNGADPWNPADIDRFLGSVKITDFDVMQLGTIHP